SVLLPGRPIKGLRLTVSASGGPETVSESSTAAHLGFLTVLHEANGFLGGYLVTNLWGRPLEFRLSTAGQPSRVQQILYADTLPGYLHGELIGQTLVEKTAMPARLILTDRRPALELRPCVEVPVVWVSSPDDPGASADGPEVVRPGLRCHP